MPTIADIERAQKRRNVLYEEFAEAAATQLIRNQLLSQDKAMEIAEYLADYLVAHWGGQNVYFPRNFVPEKTERNREIFAKLESGAAGVDALAKEHGVSRIRIYQIRRRILGKSAPVARSAETDRKAPDSPRDDKEMRQLSVVKHFIK